MDGHISSDNPFIGRNSPERNQEHEDSYHSASFTEDGKYDDTHGDGGISKHLAAQQRNHPEQREARFGQLKQKFESDESQLPYKQISKFIFKFSLQDF